MDEALSPLADPNYRGPGSYHYEAHRRVDQAARAISVQQAELAKKFPDADFSADIWTVEKVSDH